MANQKTNLTQTVISFKKLSGVANTSMFKTELGETIASNVQIGTNVIFGETPPTSPPTTMYETSSGAIVQKVEFDLVPIFGTTYIATAADSQAESSTSTTHSFALKLKSNYQTLGSNNPKVGTPPFTNNYFASGSGGTLQFVPPSFGLDYLVVLKDQNGIQITTGDDMDWYFDYYSGILFRQDGDNTTVPTSGSGYIYIGKYTDEVISSGSQGSGFPFSGSASITGSLTISGSSGPELIVTGTVEVTGGITGSLFGTASWAINSLTASYVNPLTQSVFINGGIDIYSGGNWDIYTGTHIIGTGVSPTAGPITGSGLIISASDLPPFTYNLLKVGNTEIVGYEFSGVSTLLIHNVDSFQVTSGSDGGTIKNLFVHDGDSFEIYSKESRIAYFSSSSTTIDSTDGFAVGSSVTSIKAAVTNDLTNGIAVFTQPVGAAPSSIGRVSSSLFILATGSNQIISGGLTITGSLNVTQGITSSLFGTASWAISASQAISSSYALSASYAFNATSASYAATASTVTVIDNESTNNNYAVIFADPAVGSGVQLQSDATTFTYNPNAGQVLIGSINSYTLIGSGTLTTAGGATSPYTLLDQSSQTVNFGNTGGIGAFSTLNIKHNIVNIVGSVTASIISASSGITGSLFGTASWANNAVSASHTLTASYVNTLNQDVTINGQLTAGTSSLANLTVTNNAIINGDLFVYGSASVINVENLSIEDKFILLNSGSKGPINNEGGIIVQTSASDGTAYGTALFYDQEANRWLVAKSSSVAFNATSITIGATTDFVVTVSASNGSPVGTPPNFGTGNSAYSVGQMYIQTDTSDIYIYA